MFAADVGLLPDHMFTRMLRHALSAPLRFGRGWPANSFGRWRPAAASASRRWLGLNGSLFNDDTTLPLEKNDPATAPTLGPWS